MKSNSFTKKWVTANTVGMSIAYLLYTPIAHGFTGGHERYLSAIEILIHSIALGVVALILFYFQRKALTTIGLSIGIKRYLTATLSFIFMFWLGYYLPLPQGPDYDILFGFAVLGTGMWLGSFPISKSPLLQILGILSFPLGSIVGEILLIVVVTSLDLEVEMQTGMLPHTIFWLTVGIATALVGGWILGKVLSRLISPKENTGI